MNKKRISKKGQGVPDSLMYVYKFVVLIIAMFIFVIFVNMLIQPFPDVSEAKARYYVVIGRPGFEHIKAVKKGRVYMKNINLAVGN